MGDAPLVFLPGFMGRTSDFSVVANVLGVKLAMREWQWPVPQEPMDFTAYSEWVWSALIPILPERFYCYAYSMGGRLTMSWLHRQDFRERCEGAIIASAHPGLLDEKDRELRRDNDGCWTSMFKTRPLQNVLQHWYQQTIFKSLTDAERQRQIEQKAHGNGADYAEILMAASLSTQPDYRSDFIATQNIAYLVGVEDEKFSALAKSFCSTRQLISIRNAGHLPHWEQPEQLAQAIKMQLQQWRKTYA